MLKREIEENAKLAGILEQLTNNDEQTPKAALTFWERLQKVFLWIYAATTVFIIVGVVLDIIFGNPLFHTILCAIIIGMYTLLFFLDKSINPIKSSQRFHFIGLICLWTLNLLTGILRLFF